MCIRSNRPTQTYAHTFKGNIVHWHDEHKYVRWHTHTNTQVKGENARAPHCGRAQYGVFFVMHEQRQRCCYTVSCMCVCVCILAQSHMPGSIRHVTLTSPPLRFLLFSMRIIIVWSIHSLAQSPTVCLVVCVCRRAIYVLPFWLAVLVRSMCSTTLPNMSGALCAVWGGRQTIVLFVRDIQNM